MLQACFSRSCCAAFVFLRRRAPVQHLDMSGRSGLLRTVLEAQETRGLTRSDDISRLLPAGVCCVAPVT